MSDHVALVVDSRRESDGAVAICVACCGLTGPDMEDLNREDNRSWHTIYDIHKLTRDEIAARVDAHKKAKAAQHEAALIADTHVADLVAADAPKLAQLRPSPGPKLLLQSGVSLPPKGASTPK